MTAQLEDLALGAAILGTGGGGDPYIGMLLAREAIRAHGPITMVDPRRGATTTRSSCRPR